MGYRGYTIDGITRREADMARIELEIVTVSGRYVDTITTTPERAGVALADYLERERYDPALWDNYRIRVPKGFGYDYVSAA
jgi:hypothetical protein